MGYLSTNIKNECFGCEACKQICSKNAIKMKEDSEGFRYPIVNNDLCVNCGLCHTVCPSEEMPNTSTDEKYVFGGYHNNLNVRKISTSGGAFTAIAQAWTENIDGDYLIFGAASNGLNVYHQGINDISNLPSICKSKYSQSEIGNAFVLVRDALRNGENVLFSGTPCQVAGLRAFLKNIDINRLLLVEVICEGVPSPFYIRKLDFHISEKYGSRIKTLDYRSKGQKSTPASFKWDFQRMCLELENGRVLDKDRWFNPYWSIWLNHLMSRPSCYKCPFANINRQADITLGDLWGVHLYCPELYGENGGASLIVCNNEKGRTVWKSAEKYFHGHKLEFDTALKYQSPMRKAIDMNPQRDACMMDLMDNDMNYEAICEKWAKKPSIRLLFQKYVWGNRQKVFVWNMFHNDQRGK